MFLKQRQDSSRNIVPEQLIQWSPVKLKLDGIASFVIKGIEARDERKIELIVSRTLGFDYTLLDKYAARQD